MELPVVLSIIQISLTFVLTLFILVIMLRQPLSPNLRLRFNNGKKLINCEHGENVTLSFYIENVGTLFTKPAAISVKGWVNFPSGFKPKEIRTLGIRNIKEFGLSGVYPDEGTTSVGFPRDHHVFYKEKWHFDIDVEIPRETKIYKIFIPIYHLVCIMRTAWLSDSGMDDFTCI